MKLRLLLEAGGVEGGNGAGGRAELDSVVEMVPQRGEKDGGGGIRRHRRGLEDAVIDGVAKPQVVEVSNSDKQQTSLLFATDLIRSARQPQGWKYLRRIK